MPIKLLRGSYIVCVDETADTYAEEAMLTLTKVSGERPVVLVVGWWESPVGWERKEGE